MYIQNYNLDLPSTIPLLFDCTSSTRFNLEFTNTGDNPLTSVNIKALFVPNGSDQDWLTTSEHFDINADPQPMVVGLHGDNIYNLVPGGIGIISLNCEYIYSLRVSVNVASTGNIQVKGLGI